MKTVITAEQRRKDILAQLLLRLHDRGIGLSSQQLQKCFCATFILFLEPTHLFIVEYQNSHSPELKRPRHKADHSPTFSAQVKPVKTWTFVVRTVQKSNILSGQNAKFQYVKAGGTIVTTWLSRVSLPHILENVAIMANHNSTLIS